MLPTADDKKKPRFAETLSESHAKFIFHLIRASRSNPQKHIKQSDIEASSNDFDRTHQNHLKTSMIGPCASQIQQKQVAWPYGEYFTSYKDGYALIDENLVTIPLTAQVIVELVINKDLSVNGEILRQTFEQNFSSKYSVNQESVRNTINELIAPPLEYVREAASEGYIYLSPRVSFDFKYIERIASLKLTEPKPVENLISPPDEKPPVPPQDANGPQEINRRKVHIEHIGISEEAVRYLVDRIPHCGRIEDTTVRWNTEQSFFKNMKGYIAALRQSPANFRSITGPLQDLTYVKALQSAYGKQAWPDGRPERKIKCFRLKHTMPLMNFVLLYDFERRPMEVLFGFGTHRDNLSDQDTPVFRSTNRPLIKEYQRLFADLRTERYSREISVDDPEFSSSCDYKSDVLATFRQFPFESIREKIVNCRPGKNIVICTTAWPSFEPLRIDLQQALQKGCTVDVALWEEQSEFAKLRGKELQKLGGGDDFNYTIQSNKATLKALLGTQGFTMHWCTAWAPMTLFWIDDLIYFSLYWAGDYASHGPHFLVHAKSETGKRLKAQYSRMLPNAEKQLTTGAALS